jgi:quercetin dioxygenase-like cupin family protein
MRAVVGSQESLMVVTPNSAPERSTLPGIQHTTLAGTQQGLRQLSVWQQILDVGAATPPHRHDCEEVVLCLAGTGELRIDGQSPYGFGPNTTVCIPRDVLHQLVNSGPEPLQIIAVFSATPVEAYLPSGELIDLPWAS